MGDDVDYTLMGDGQVAEACGDSGARWAEAFVQFVRKHGLSPFDQDTMRAWFANAIEAATVTRARVDRVVPPPFKNDDERDGYWRGFDAGREEATIAARVPTGPVTAQGLGEALLRRDEARAQASKDIERICARRREDKDKHPPIPVMAIGSAAGQLRDALNAAALLRKQAEDAMADAQALTDQTIPCAEAVAFARREMDAAVTGRR